jgi:hypothetical protein
VSTPEPTAQTVVADVHTALDTAKTDALAAVAAVEHIGFGTAVDDVKKVISDSIEALKASVHDLLHGAQPAVPAPATSPDTPPTA